jgi:hypothetical protein
MLLDKLDIKFSWKWLAALLALICPLVNRISIFWQTWLVAGGAFPDGVLFCDANLAGVPNARFSLPTGTDPVRVRCVRSHASFYFVTVRLDICAARAAG